MSPIFPRRVSVIIPTRHRLKLLQRAIDSVNRQSYDDIEIVVFDNFSDTPIERSSLDSRLPLKIVRSETFERLPVSRNRALAGSEGAFVAYLDDDDEYMPEKIADQMAVFEADPTAEMVYGNTEQRFSDGSSSLAIGPAEIEDYLQFRYIHPNSFTARRDVVESIPFDPRMTTFEDVMFLAKVLRTRKVVHVDRTHAIWYRDKRPDQMTNRNYRRAYENWKRLCDEFRPELLRRKDNRQLYFSKMLKLSLMFFDVKEAFASLKALSMK